MYARLAPTIARAAVVRVREGDRLDLPVALNSAAIRERLLASTTDLPFDVLVRDRKGLRAAGAVGLLDVGALRVEFLPRVSSTSSMEDDSRFLVDLLSSAGLFPRVARRNARISLTANSVMEHVIGEVAEEISTRLLSGPPRRYSERSDELEVIRGRIDFGVLARREPGREHLIPVRYAPLQRDNSLARLVLAVVNRLLALTRSSRNRILLQRLAGVLSGVKARDLTVELVTSAVPNRLESSWMPTWEVAQALVVGKAPNPVVAGGLSAGGLLFSLNDLFEAALRRLLPAALAATAYNLDTRPTTLNLLRSEEGREVLRLRPDFVFRRDQDGVKAFVGDAKWKRLQQTSASLGLQPGDTYQLATYMARHGLNSGILFFPQDEWMAKAPSAAWRRTFGMVGGNARVHLLSVDIQGLLARQSRSREAALVRLQESLVAVLAAGS